MEKFHYFLYGKEFTLETDQKPLVSIYKKHMVDISPRVQRLIVRSFPYQPFNVIYKKEKDIPVADALSQVTPMDPEDNIKLPIIAVNLIIVHILLCAHPQDTFSRKLDQLSVTSTVFESKDDPTQMTKAVIYNYILYYIQKTIHSNSYAKMFTVEDSIFPNTWIQFSNPELN